MLDACDCPNGTRRMDFRYIWQTNKIHQQCPQKIEKIYKNKDKWEPVRILYVVEKPCHDWINDDNKIEYKTKQ